MNIQFEPYGDPNAYRHSINYISNDGKMQITFEHQVPAQGGPCDVIIFKKRLREDSTKTFSIEMRFEKQVIHKIYHLNFTDVDELLSYARIRHIKFCHECDSGSGINVGPAVKGIRLDDLRSSQKYKNKNIGEITSFNGRDAFHYDKYKHTGEHGQNGSGLTLRKPNNYEEAKDSILNFLYELMAKSPFLQMIRDCIVSIFNTPEYLAEIKKLYRIR